MIEVILIYLGVTSLGSWALVAMLASAVLCLWALSRFGILGLMVAFLAVVWLASIHFDRSSDPPANSRSGSMTGPGNQ